MTPKLVPYNPERDFLRVRDFLVRTYSRFDAPVNWGIERLNYARYFVAPMLGAYGTDDGSLQGSLDAIRLWEDLVGLWEFDGEIVGAVAVEHPDITHPGYGDIFIQRHPDHLELLNEMFEHCERRLARPETGETSIFVWDDDAPLLEVVQRHGYIRNEKRTSSHLEYAIDDVPEPSFPDGFIVRTMTQEQDVDKRREIFGRAFNHEDPREWPSRFAYEELMRAPDYAPDNDLVVIAPDGTYAACCLVWPDDANRVGHLEPLGTHPAYRRRGLARALLLEALHRLKRMGAEKMPMTDGFNPFYESVGFRKLRSGHMWEKQPAA